MYPLNTASLMRLQQKVSIMSPIGVGLTASTHPTECAWVLAVAAGFLVCRRYSKPFFPLTHAVVLLRELTNRVPLPERAGKRNRTSIAGVQSQSNSHYTIPAEAELFLMLSQGLGLRTHPRTQHFSLLPRWPGRIRTYDLVVNSHPLCQLSYGPKRPI